MLNPLNEGPGWSADRWGYRRYPVSWDGGDIMLPSAAVGPNRWLVDPMGVAADLGIDDRLRSCSLP